MYFSESEGESSERQENYDSSSNPRHLPKKARFAWQVKGKHHLRNPTCDEPKTAASHAPKTDSICNSSDSDSDYNDTVRDTRNTEQNLEILGDYLLKQDLKTFQGGMDSSLSKPYSEILTGNVSYPRYIRSNNRRNGISSALNRPFHLPFSSVGPIPPMIPPSLPQPITENQCISQWQTKQMAMAHIDNTINNVLESWLTASNPVEMDRHLVTDLINNLPDDNSIENQGILMAISAHGLQNTGCSISALVLGESSSHSSRSNVYPSPPSSPVSKALEYSEYSASVAECTLDQVSSESTPTLLSMPESDSSSSSSEKAKVVTETNSEDYTFLNHYPAFIDRAVMYTIQTKGLAAFHPNFA